MSEVYLEPDVGYAWVIVVASFVMQACAVGVVSGMGSLKEHYTHVFQGEAQSKVALTVSLGPVMLGMGSFITGRVCQQFGVRACTLAGALFMTGGFLLASFGTQIWHLALSQGVMLGFGAALIYVPANVAITEWFEKKRGLAAGLGASGGGVGGALFNQLNTSLLPQVGLQYTLQINACIVLVVLLCSAAMVRRRKAKPTSDSEETVFDISLILNTKFGIFSVSSFLCGCAYFVPIIFINDYVVSMGMSAQEAGVAGSVINIGSAIGRIMMGLLGDYIGHFQCYALSIGLSAVTSILWRFSTNFTMLILFGILYGIPSGGFAGGFGPTCATVFGQRQLATVMGIAYSFVGLGELVGPIISGLLIDSFGYLSIVYFTIACYTADFVAICLTGLFLNRNPQ